MVARVDFGACVLFAPDGTLTSATVRGRLMGRRKSLGNAVVVGDRVRLEPGAGGPVVTEVEPRRNAFSRRAAGEPAGEQVVAANLDQLVLVASVAQPEFVPGLADRVLAQAEHAGLPARLVLNKTDLGEARQARALLGGYERAGVSCHAVCAPRGEGVEGLLDLGAQHPEVVSIVLPAGKGLPSVRCQPVPSRGAKETFADPTVSVMEASTCRGVSLTWRLATGRRAAAQSAGAASNTAPSEGTRP